MFYCYYVHMEFKSFSDEMSFATDLALTAGTIVTEQFGQHTETDWKQDNTPVTQADIDINELVIREVQDRFPDHGVLGEEVSYEPNRERIWVVDPIDGTQPYSLGVPISTFCISLVVNNEPVIGVIYDPFMKRMYKGVKGEGSYMNSERLNVAPADELNQNYVVMSSRMGGKFISTGQALDRIVEAGGKVFNFRSIAYGCMLVATGGAIAAIAGYLKPWDAAATIVILEEAGATITDLTGAPVTYDQNVNGLLVSNGNVHQKLSNLLG